MEGELGGLPTGRPRWSAHDDDGKPADAPAHISLQNRFFVKQG
jgi:hypothetical protein